MSELSLSPAERSRKAFAMVLRAMEEPGTQRNLSQAMGTSETTVSRIKTAMLEDSLALLYQLGFKVVSGDRVCVDRNKYEAMATIARAAMSCEVTTNRLIWDDDQS